MLQRRSYTYRADGFLTAEQDQLSGPRRFDVDRVGQVTGVYGNGWSERYSYDPSGNITRARWPASPRAEVINEREYMGTLIQRAGAVHYVHDSQGRIIRRKHALPSGKPETWHYTWGPRTVCSVLSRLMGNGGGTATTRSAGVSPSNFLVPTAARWYPGGLHLGRHPTRRTAPDGSHATVWDWEPDSHRAVSQTERVTAQGAPQQWVDQQFYAVVTDLVGTPTELIGPNGTLAWHARTTLWGVPLRQNSSTDVHAVAFPGQYFDPETELHYNFHRYYDPFTGRYLVMDPLGLDAGPRPQAYVRNPTAWIDPLGLMPGACGENANATTAWTSTTSRMASAVSQNRSPTTAAAIGSTLETAETTTPISHHRRRRTKTGGTSRAARASMTGRRTRS